MVAVKYTSNSKVFDEILQAVGDYFELFRNATDTLENLWLQVLAYLNMKPPTKSCIIRRIHFEHYKKQVIHAPILKLLKARAIEAAENQEGSEALRGNLDKIREIDEFKVQEETYSNFRARVQNSYDFNHMASTYLNTNGQLQPKPKQRQQQ